MICRLPSPPPYLEQKGRTQAGACLLCRHQQQVSLSTPERNLPCAASTRLDSMHACTQPFSYLVRLKRGMGNMFAPRPTPSKMHAAFLNFRHFSLSWAGPGFGLLTEQCAPPRPGATVGWSHLSHNRLRDLGRPQLAPRSWGEISQVGAGAGAPPRERSPVSRVKVQYMSHTRLRDVM